MSLPDGRILDMYEVEQILGGIVKESSGGGNPFNQSLNTSDAPDFAGISMFGDPFVDSSQVYYPQSTNPVFDVSGNIKYFSGTVLTDSVNFLADPGGNNMADGAGGRFSGDYKYADASGLYYLNGQLLVENFELKDSSGGVIADGTYLNLPDSGTEFADSMGLFGDGSRLSGLTVSQFGVTPVADGTYTLGLGVTTNGTITTQSGIIIAITEAS